MSLPGRFLDTSSGRIYVHRAFRRSTSGAPPIVLLHGYMMSHWYFHGLLPRLSERRDVIAVDLPGYGESDRPALGSFGYDYPSFAGVVVEVLDKLGLERATVLGHSMGGGVALTLASRWPERVERLVLECPAVYPLPFPVEAKLVLNKLVGRFLFSNGISRWEIRRQMLKQHFKDASVVTDELVDHVWARLNRPGGRDAAWATLNTFASLSDETSEPMRVRAPTLLLWGDEDRMIPLQHGRRLSRAISGASLSIVPASGHNVHLERRDEFLRQLMPFLDGEERVSTAGAPPLAEALGGAR